jgi:hypothetical protein
MFDTWVPGAYARRSIVISCARADADNNIPARRLPRLKRPGEGERNLGASANADGAQRAWFDSSFRGECALSTRIKRWQEVESAVQVRRRRLNGRFREEC